MIKYNLNTINNWNYGSNNIKKVYYHNAVVFYKITGSGDTPTYKVCYAVVDNISQYQDREFVDVYDKATNKWYKLNNLNQYEQYGVYGEGRNITYYDGKLTVDDGYEYQYSGGSWVNVGEISGSSKTSDFKLADIGDSITSDLSLVTDGMCGIILPVSLSSNTSSAEALLASNDSNRLSNLSAHTHTSVINENDIIDYAVWKFHATSTSNVFYIENTGTNKYFGYDSVNSSNSLPLVDESSKVPVLLSVFTINNVTAIGFVKNNTPYQNYAINNLYAYNNRYNWWNALIDAGDLNNSFVLYKISASSLVVPVEYSERAEPLNGLTFQTIEEANTYAYNNCVYDGMNANIDGTKYYFDSDEGWVEKSFTELEYIETVRNSNNSGLQLPIISQEGNVYEMTCLVTSYTADPKIIGTKTASELICGYEFGVCYYDTLGVFVDMGDRISSNNFISSKSIIKAGQTDSNNHSLYTLTVNDRTYSKNISSYCLTNFKVLIGDLIYTSQTNDTLTNVNSRIQLRIFGLKIWNNYGQTLIADYVPCLDSNNSPNLYDTISGTYATPLGNLTAGPEV